MSCAKWSSWEGVCVRNCNTSQHTLQHTATQCNTHHNATHTPAVGREDSSSVPSVAKKLSRRSSCCYMGHDSFRRNSSLLRRDRALLQGDEVLLRRDWGLLWRIRALLRRDWALWRRNRRFCWEIGLFWREIGNLMTGFLLSCGTWLIHMSLLRKDRALLRRDRARLRRDACYRLGFIRMCDMSHSGVWPGSYICVTWLI